MALAGWTQLWFGKVKVSNNDTTVRFTLSARLLRHCQCVLLFLCSQFTKDDVHWCSLANLKILLEKFEEERGSLLIIFRENEAIPSMLHFQDFWFSASSQRPLQQYRQCHCCAGMRVNLTHIRNATTEPYLLRCDRFTQKGSKAEWVRRCKYFNYTFTVREVTGLLMCFSAPSGKNISSHF